MSNPVKCNRIEIDYEIKAVDNMKEIKRMIAQISGHRNRECYMILSYAVEAASRYQPQEPKMETIVSDVAVMLDHQKGGPAISRALSRAVEDIWKYGSRKELEKFWGGPLLEPPPPRALVLRLAEYVWSRRDSRGPHRGITYRWCRTPMRTGYGIVVTTRSPRCQVIGCPVCTDLETVQRLVRVLNEEQLPLEDFEERCLTRTLLDWMRMVERQRQNL